MKGEFITREGSSIKDAEEELEKHIDPVSGYPYYLNVRTGDTSWAHEDDCTEHAAFTYAEGLHDNPVQLDQEHKEWEIDHTCNSEVQWVIDETEYIGFGGGDGKHVATSSHINARLAGSEYEKIDKVGKVDMLLLNHKAESIPFDEFTQFSQPDEVVVTTAEENNLVDNDSKQVAGRKEYDSNFYIECELDVTSCCNRVGTANESLARRKSCVESLAQIRYEKGQTEKEEFLTFLTSTNIWSVWLTH